jgi:chemotaxis protein CheC
MGFEEKITSTHLDVLREVGNIGAGNAATALSTLLKKKIDMKVPNVKVVSFDEVMGMAGGAENVVVSIFLRIEGEAPGSMFFLLPLEQAAKFSKVMLEDDSISFEKPPYSELGLSALQELGNILSGSYLTALSDFTSLNLSPSVPALSIDMAGAIIEFGLLELSQMSDYAIVIDTTLKEGELQDLDSVKGQFFLLPDPASFKAIFESLGVKVNE